MDCGKVPSGVGKVKKKQVKDELDRLRQAEKKKRRLEKALANSAAIISELEKKKQKKKEEQQRLDEEGAAIAEAVALQVLSGEDEDSDEEFNTWECCDGARTTAAVIPRPHSQLLSRSPNEETGWVSNAFGGSGCVWNGYGWVDGGSFVSGWEGMEVSGAGLMAAQGVSSLQIADDEDVNAFVFDRMLKG